VLNGLYLWSDLCDDELYAIDPSAAEVVARPLGLGLEQPTSFGTDALGRVYVVTAGGGVYRIDPAR
jgi:hypothetical protein